MRRVVLIALCFAAVSACSKSKSEGSASGQSSSKAQSADHDGEAKSDAVDLPEAEAILAKAVEAVGGRDKLDAIDSYHYKGEISILGQNIAGDSEIWWQNGDFYSESHMAGIGEIRAGKSGETIWSEDPINGLRELDGAEAEQHTWASSLMLAADWKRYFASAKTVAERNEDGRTLYDVKLVSDSGAEVLLTFDAESGLQVEQSFDQFSPMGSTPVEMTMEDYREVDGIKVAHKQLTDAGLAKATLSITTLEFNPEVDTSRFAKPAPETEVVDKKTMMPFDADGKPGKPVPK